MEGKSKWIVPDRRVEGHQSNRLGAYRGRISVSPKEPLSSFLPSFPRPMARVEANETFNAPPREVYRALTDANMVQTFTGSPAEINATAGGAFSLLNGNITGTMVELKEGEKIVQTWRSSEWETGITSVVTLQLVAIEEGETTLVELVQTGVPRDAVDRVERGWHHQFFNRMHAMLGI